MRTIKFRGKDVETGKWRYGYLGDGNLICDWNNNNRHSFEVKATTVGEFTGLLDKNGKEIYEGDILKVYYYGKSKVFGFVRFGRSRFFIDDDFLRNELEAKAPMTELFSHYSFEVVGNIHDNPELLKNIKK